MNIEIMYWVVMIVWLIVGLVSDRANLTVVRVLPLAVEFILFVLIGFKVFGNPFK